MNPFTTVIVGVVVFVIGQLTLRAIIEPISRFREVRAEIAELLHFYAAIIHNPSNRYEVTDDEELKDELKEVSKQIRRLASKLHSSTISIPFYNMWAFIGYIPNKNRVSNAKTLLVGISNSIIVNNPDFVGEKNREKVEIIEKDLKLSLFKINILETDNK